MTKETKNRMKNSKEKRKLSANKWRSGEVLMNFYIYKKKSNMEKNTKKMYVNL